jgi:hypothetical protein
MCFYNEGCYYPTINMKGLSNIPVNNIISHIPYVIAAMHGFLQIVLAEDRIEKAFKKKFGENGESSSEGQKANFTVLYGICWAFLGEAFGSTCYHTCPSVSTFQFDTAFMIIICHLCCFALYEWGDIDVAAFVLRYMLFVAIPMWIFNFIGTFYDAGMFEGGMITGFYWVYGFSQLAWSISVTRGIDILFKHDSTSSTRGLIIKILVIITMIAAMFTPFRVTMGGMANIFLILSILGMSITVASKAWELEFRFQHVRKMRDLCDLLVKYSYMFWFPPLTYVALDCFTDKTALVGPGVDSAESHQQNQPCVIQVFDKHDVWHCFSAIDLALFAMMLLHIKVHSFARKHEELTIFAESESDSESDDSSE